MVQTPPKQNRENIILEVYWPPITFSTSTWLWWNAVSSAPTPNMTVQMTPPHTLPKPPHPPIKLLFVNQIWRTCETGHFSHHLHSTHRYKHPTVETRVLGTVSIGGAGGSTQMREGLCNLSCFCVRRVGGWGGRTKIISQTSKTVQICLL